MKVVYREGEATILAEALEIVKLNSALMITFQSGKTIQRSFPTAEVLDQFFEEVVLNAGDRPIRLEQTNFEPRLSQLLDDWDSLYED